jgi:hypothetical protein
MEKNRDNLNENRVPIEQAEMSGSKETNWWRPVLLFYIKTTSWIVFPLLLGLIGGIYVGKSTGSQVIFFIFMMLGFVITCFGIYQEIKNYKKLLDVPSRKEIEEKLNNVSKSNTR